MNMFAKVVCWGTIVMAVLGSFGLMSESQLDWWGIFAAALYVTISSIALTYIWKDDEVRAVNKERAIEQRIAAMVEGRNR